MDVEGMMIRMDVDGCGGDDDEDGCGGDDDEDGCGGDDDEDGCGGDDDGQFKCGLDGERTVGEGVAKRAVWRKIGRNIDPHIEVGKDAMEAEVN